jgi:hypothetical protein
MPEYNRSTYEKVPTAEGNGDGHENNGHINNGKLSVAERLKAAGAKPPEEPSDRLRSFTEFLDAKQVKKDKYVALCPFHYDEKPSLHIDLGKGGRILIHCFAGCQTDKVLEMVGLRTKHLMPGVPLPKKIVANYKYCDEEGNLLYETVRFDPKAFCQRRPGEKGGWVYKLEGVRRILYRLPELLASPSEEYVLLPEGEKDVERLRKEGFIATTTVGGAKAPWKSAYAEALRGRNVVLLADNDPTGWDRVKTVARELYGKAASVRIPTFPESLPAKGDVSDWFDAGGTKETLRELIAKTPLYDPQGRVPCDPVGNLRVNSFLYNDLGTTSRIAGSQGRVLPPVSPFPVDALPKPLGDFARTIAEALPCPPDFPGAMMLPPLGSCIGRKRCIEAKPGWTEYPVLWVVAIGRSGARKSPAFEKVTSPLRNIQRKLHAQYIREKEKFAKLTPEEREGVEKPKLQQTHTTDTTIEALKKVLDTTPNGICYAKDELLGWVRSMNQYKGGKGDDRTHWLSIWSGSQAAFQFLRSFGLKWSCGLADRNAGRCSCCARHGGLDPRNSLDLEDSRERPIGTTSPRAQPTEKHHAVRSRAPSPCEAGQDVLAGCLAVGSALADRTRVGDKSGFTNPASAASLDAGSRPAGLFGRPRPSREP